MGDDFGMDVTHLIQGVKELICDTRVARSPFALAHMQSPVVKKIHILTLSCHELTDIFIFVPFYSIEKKRKQVTSAK